MSKYNAIVIEGPEEEFGPVYTPTIVVNVPEFNVGDKVIVTVEKMPEFKVIIAGSRTFNNYDLLKEKCDSILQNKKQTHAITIISGCAKGADTLGEKYAMYNNCYLDKHPADWDKYGKSAGYKRNVEMAEIADACICFWDGKSKGTKHMIDIAKQKGLMLKVINYENKTP